jgi:ribonuclease HI
LFLGLCSAVDFITLHATMPFKEMKFKGKPVFVETDEAGAVLSEKGRARMKYRLDDDRIYNPNISNLTPLNGSNLETTPAKDLIDAGNRTSSRKRKASPGGIPAGSSAPPRSAIIAYTDGACSGNPGPAGLGYVIRFPDGRTIQKGEPLGSATNNIAELTAILRVLQSLDSPDQTVVIHTDSSYAIGLLTKGWKAKANVALIESIRAVLNACPNVTFVKVKGHAGVPDNELVDTLAREAAETQTVIE